MHYVNLLIISTSIVSFYELVHFQLLEINSYTCKTCKICVLHVIHIFDSKTWLLLNNSSVASACDIVPVPLVNEVKHDMN